jgi:hypothetical protein
MEAAVSLVTTKLFIVPEEVTFSVVKVRPLVRAKFVVVMFVASILVAVSFVRNTLPRVVAPETARVFRADAPETFKPPVVTLVSTTFANVVFPETVKVVKAERPEIVNVPELVFVNVEFVPTSELLVIFVIFAFTATTFPVALRPPVVIFVANILAKVLLLATANVFNVVPVSTFSELAVIPVTDKLEIVADPVIFAVVKVASPVAFIVPVVRPVVNIPVPMVLVVAAIVVVTTEVLVTLVIVAFEAIKLPSVVVPVTERELPSTAAPDTFNPPVLTFVAKTLASVLFPETLSVVKLDNPVTVRVLVVSFVTIKFVVAMLAVVKFVVFTLVPKILPNVALVKLTLARVVLPDTATDVNVLSPLANSVPVVIPVVAVSDASVSDVAVNVARTAAPVTLRPPVVTFVSTTLANVVFPLTASVVKLLRPVTFKAPDVVPVATMFVTVPDPSLKLEAVKLVIFVLVSLDNPLTTKLATVCVVTTLFAIVAEPVTLRVVKVRPEVKAKLVVVILVTFKFVDV